jgi:hypothetical protein
MNKKMRIMASLISLLAAGSASAAVTCSGVADANLVNSATDPVTGHYFEVYVANGIDWATANSSASGRTCNDAVGHLATITSSAEEAFVDKFRHDSVGNVLTQPQVWVGGFWDAGVWRWVNNEGSFPAANTGPAYSNWASDEPNNLGVEIYMALGRFDSGGPWVDGGWNNEGTALDTIGGYIVEYDVPRPAACTGASCQTITGQFLTFPPGSFAPGDTIKFNAYEFSDPRVGTAGKCGVDPLTLFDDPNDGMPPLRIPAYLCGSPKFVVVAVDSSQLDILDGTVFVENQTNVVLPNNLYRCHDPIVRNFPTQGDPQFEDVVVWQTTDPTHMLEDTRGVGQFAGAAGEFTSSCGSSQAKIKGASYYVVGLHIDFGPGYLWSANTAGNNERFTALTRYKLTLLQQAVANALTAHALTSVDATKMSAQLTSAVKYLDRGDPDDALENVNRFLKLVAAAKYTVVPGQNYNGEHVMRGTNIQFMLRVKVIPYTPHH